MEAGNVERNELEISPESKNCCWRCGNYLRSPKFRLYASYAFSTWGDRMWTFALSIALYSIGGNLRLPAVTGFANGAAVLIFAPYVGKWIDNTARLKAAQASLTINNMSVGLSAGCLVGLLHWSDQILPIWDGALYWSLVVGSIILCAVSVLAGTGTKICLTKDWVVVMAKHDKEILAEMNAMLLRIDLTAMIISPLVAGQIMTSISLAAGCFFIAVWNVCSYAIEFFLLLAVYRSVPGLKKDKPMQSSQTNEFNQAESELKILDGSDKLEENPEKNELKTTILPSNHSDNSTSGQRRGVLQRLFSSAIFGYTVYFRQAVWPAGLGLALLYLTVMGLEGITSGYAYSQGIKENVLAAVRGAGALSGISGSFAYPRLRTKIGLERTALIGFGLEISCLCLSVASIWMPGSPFDIWAAFQPNSDNNKHVFSNTSSLIPTLNGGASNGTMNDQDNATMEPSSMLSIWAFLIGIVLARFGLWTVDLSITQIMQEAVAEKERGAVFGVQSAMNQLLNLAKDLLVIGLPDPKTFGILIIVSWLSVCSGYLSYSMYSRKVRGHVLPFHGNRFKDVQFRSVSENTKL